MAGGNWKLSSQKDRPGTYINVVNGKPAAATAPIRGTVTFPLIGYDWGPREEWIHITKDSPDAAMEKLGRSVYSDNDHMMLIRLAFMNAAELWIYIAGGGEKAKGNILAAEAEDGGAASVSVEAKYAGTLGNTIKLVSVANPQGGFDLTVMLGETEVELFENVKTFSEVSSKYVDFSTGGALTEIASVTLSGGTEDDSKQNASITKYYDMSEKIRFGCMALPTDDKALITAMITKIKYIRNAIGWKCHAVAVNTAADCEGIYNLVNAFELNGKKLTPAQAAVWLAGADAASDYVTSLTYKVVEGAIAVVGEKPNEEAVASIKNGETFFSIDESGNIILEYDINSKVTFTDADPVDINKGRPCRVYDTIANELLVAFVPGQFSNNPEAEDWSVMEGLGRAMLSKYQSDGAIWNVDLENDFVVDRGLSVGNSVFVTVGVQPVDSAEKYYITVNAR